MSRYIFYCIICQKFFYKHTHSNNSNFYFEGIDTLPLLSLMKHFGNIPDLLNYMQFVLSEIMLCVIYNRQ